MKTNAKSMLFVSTLIGLTILSCKKENDLNPAPTNGTGGSGNISTFFNENATPKQTFTINADQYQTITGTKGTILQFQPGSFKTPSGQLVNGSVSIELREMYSKVDMILNKATTMSNNKLLVSGGELFLQAFQNGIPLSLTSSNVVYAKMPTSANSPPMSEFYSNESFVFEGDLDWSFNDSTSTDSIIVSGDSIDFGGYNYYYEFNLDAMNWINCDYFYNSQGPFTDIDVSLNTQFNMTNCVVYVSFDGMNSVTSLTDYNDDHTYNYGYESFPQGLNVHIVAISNINGQLYSSFTPATLTANFSTNVTLTATTLAQITANVNSLP